jgi:N-acetylmuramoyl-L-alanine amidase
LRASDFSEKPGNNNDSANIALATAIHANCIKRTGRADRGVRRARYSVITGVKHPAILLEGGFLSNHTEGSQINSSAYKDRLAFAIAEAVVKYKYATRGAQAQR